MKSLVKTVAVIVWMTLKTRQRHGSSDRTSHLFVPAMVETRTSSGPSNFYGSLATWAAKLWEFSPHPAAKGKFPVREEKVMPVITVHPSFPSVQVYPTASATNSLSSTSAKTFLTNTLGCYKKRTKLDPRAHSAATIQTLFSQLSSSTPSLSSPSPGLQTATATFVHLAEFEFGGLVEPYIQLDPLDDDFYIVESSKGL